MYIFTLSAPFAALDHDRGSISVRYGNSSHSNTSVLGPAGDPKPATGAPEYSALKVRESGPDKRRIYEETAMGPLMLLALLLITNVTGANCCTVRAVMRNYVGNIQHCQGNLLSLNCSYVDMDQLLAGSRITYGDYGMVRVVGNKIRFLITGDPCYNDFESSICANSKIKSCLHRSLLNYNDEVLGTVNSIPSFINALNAINTTNKFGYVDANPYGIKSLIMLGLTYVSYCNGCPGGIYPNGAEDSPFKVCMNANYMAYTALNCTGDSTIGMVYSREIYPIRIVVKLTGLESPNVRYWITRSFETVEELICDLPMITSSYLEVNSEIFKNLVVLMRNLRTSDRLNKRAVTTNCYGGGLGFIWVNCNLEVGITESIKRGYSHFASLEQLAIVKNILQGLDTRVNGLYTIVNETVNVVTQLGSMVLSTRTELNDVNDRVFTMSGIVNTITLELEENTRMVSTLSNEVTNIQNWMLNDILNEKSITDTDYQTKLLNFKATDPSIIDFIPSGLGDVVLKCVETFGPNDKGLYILQSGSPVPHLAEYGKVGFYGLLSVTCKGRVNSTMNVVDPMLSYGAPCMVDNGVGSTYMSGWFNPNFMNASYYVFSPSMALAMREGFKNVSIIPDYSGNKKICINGSCILATDYNFNQSLQLLINNNEVAQSTNEKISNETKSLLKELDKSSAFRILTQYGNATSGMSIFVFIVVMILLIDFLRRVYVEYSEHAKRQSEASSHESSSIGRLLSLNKIL